eukprot:m.35535 g.35535  ORF g.35535 m.35535 type:complete len:80 (+) comp13258_c0_seq1:55-294(+)
MMSPAVRQSLLVGAIISAAGYAFVSYITPSPEELVKRLPPNKQKEYEEKQSSTERRAQQFYNVLRQAAENEKPVYRKKE